MSASDVTVRDGSAVVRLALVDVVFERQRDGAPWRLLGVYAREPGFWIDEAFLAQARANGVEAMRRHEQPDVLRCPQCHRLLCDSRLTSHASAVRSVACGQPHVVELEDGTRLSIS